MEYLRSNNINGQKSEVKFVTYGKEIGTNKVRRILRHASTSLTGLRLYQDASHRRRYKGRCSMTLSSYNAVDRCSQDKLLSQVNKREG